MNKSSWGIIFSVLFFLIINISIAQPPFAEISIETGLIDILYPFHPYHKANTNHTFSFHAFNSTGHILKSDTTSCYFHLYNREQGYIFEDELPFSGSDFKQEINGANFSMLGIHPFNVWCNSTQGQGGSVEGELVVTITGRHEDGDINFNGSGIIISLSIIGLALLYSSFKINEEYKDLRLFSYTISFGFFIAALQFAVSYSNLLVNQQGVKDLSEIMFWLICAVFLVIMYLRFKNSMVSVIKQGQVNDNKIKKGPCRWIRKN